MAAPDEDFKRREKEIAEEFGKIFMGEAMMTDEEKAAAAERDAKEALRRNIDGVRMIKLFVQNNRMTLWKVSQKSMLRRKVACEKSYQIAEEMKKQGKLDHIQIPETAYVEALKRKHDESLKPSFSGILADNMKDMTLSELDDATEQYRMQREALIANRQAAMDFAENSARVSGRRTMNTSPARSSVLCSPERAATLLLQENPNDNEFLQQ